MGATDEDGRVDLGRSLREDFNRPVRALRDLPKPVVAAVNGPAVGIAVSYALACDHVVAARSAYVLLSFVNIGLVPDGGASALIPARVGAARFAQLALLGERLPAEQALAWGLVDRMTEDAELLPAAARLARGLAAGATGAQAAIKRMVNAGPLAGLDAALALEADLQGARGGDPEFQEGVAAFLEKRPPRFDASRTT
jgi:2-(1,2-epoxy-1,2-dihydrophenyl)acetyl-CoA isomerase